MLQMVFLNSASQRFSTALLAARIELPAPSSELFESEESSELEAEAGLLNRRERPPILRNTVHVWQGRQALAIWRESNGVRAFERGLDRDRVRFNAGPS